MLVNKIVCTHITKINMCIDIFYKYKGGDYPVRAA